MSRPLTSTSVLETTGAFEKNPDRKRTGEPTPPVGPMIKPKLKGLASKIWDQYAPICEGMGTAARGDELAFAKLCNVEAEYQKDPEGFQTSRLAEHLRILERFGIAGSGSRAKLGTTAKKTEEKADPATKYLNAIRPGNSLRQ